MRNAVKHIASRLALLGGVSSRQLPAASNTCNREFRMDEKEIFSEGIPIINESNTIICRTFYAIGLEFTGAQYEFQQVAH